MQFYHQALLYGDLVKLVGVATWKEDSFTASQFQKLIESAGHETALIAISIAVNGPLSRIQNGFLTPFFHLTIQSGTWPASCGIAEGFM